MGEEYNFRGSQWSIDVPIVPSYPSIQRLPAVYLSLGKLVLQHGWPYLPSRTTSYLEIRRINEPGV